VHRHVLRIHIPRTSGGAYTSGTAAHKHRHALVYGNLTVNPNPTLTKTTRHLTLPHEIRPTHERSCSARAAPCPRGGFALRRCAPARTTGKSRSTHCPEPAQANSARAGKARTTGRAGRHGDDTDGRLEGSTHVVIGNLDCARLDLDRERLQGGRVSARTGGQAGSGCRWGKGRRLPDRMQASLARRRSRGAGPPATRHHSCPTVRACTRSHRSGRTRWRAGGGPCSSRAGSCPR
jgi:hypothetical protein